MTGTSLEGRKAVRFGDLDAVPRARETLENAKTGLEICSAKWDGKWGRKVDAFDIDEPPTDQNILVHKIQVKSPEVKSKLEEEFQRSVDHIEWESLAHAHCHNVPSHQGNAPSLTSELKIESGHEVWAPAPAGEEAPKVPVKVQVKPGAAIAQNGQA